MTGCSCLWSIKELFEQRERVRKGWFPENPKRKAKLEEKSKTYDFKSLAEWYTRENVGKEYSRDTKEWLEDLANPKEFTAEELKNLEIFLQ